MIGYEYDDRVVAEACVFQGLQKLADLVIDVADHAVVSVTRIADTRFSLSIFTYCADMVKPPAVGIELVEGNWRHFGHIDVSMTIPAPALSTSRALNS